MEQVLAWWQARTGREQRLVQFATILIFIFVLPVWAYVAASGFREAAAARLAAAMETERQVALIVNVGRERAAAPQGEDGSVRARVMAAAQALALTTARIEAIDPERVRIAFEPADSLAIYRWIEAVGRSGAHVSRSTIVRTGDSALVAAEFEVVGSP